MPFICPFQHKVCPMGRRPCSTPPRIQACRPTTASVSPSAKTLSHHARITHILTHLRTYSLCEKIFLFGSRYSGLPEFWISSISKVFEVRVRFYKKNSGAQFSVFNLVVPRQSWLVNLTKSSLINGYLLANPASTNFLTNKQWKKSLNLTKPAIFLENQRQKQSRRIRAWKKYKRRPISMREITCVGFKERELVSHATVCVIMFYIYVDRYIDAYLFVYTRGTWASFYFLPHPPLSLSAPRPSHAVH